MFMGLTMFADEVSVVENTKTNEFTTVIDKYDFTVNYERFESCLELYPYQIECFEQFFDKFKHDMIQASNKSDESEQKKIVNASVAKNFRLMRTILEFDQYRKYVLLIQTTLVNRGLKV